MISEEQALAEMVTHPTTEIKFEKTYELASEYSIRVIPAEQYVNRHHQADPQIKIIKHIFEASNLVEYMKPESSKTTFLAINEGDTIIGFLHGKIKDKIFYVTALVYGKKFQEVHFPKEQLEKRLFLKALEKVKELHLELFHQISFSWEIKKYEKLANEKIEFFSSFQELGLNLKVETRFGRSGPSESKITVRIRKEE